MVPGYNFKLYNLQSLDFSVFQMDKVTFATYQELGRFNEVTYLKCYLGENILLSLQIMPQLDWRGKRYHKVSLYCAKAMNYHLQEIGFMKSNDKEHIRIMKSIRSSQEEHKPDEVESFMTGRRIYQRHPC